MRKITKFNLLKLLKSNNQTYKKYVNNKNEIKLYYNTYKIKKKKIKNITFKKLSFFC